VTAQMTDMARALGEAHDIETGAIVKVDEHVAQTILDIARAHGADAIAMATHARGVSRFVLGSIADKVIRGSHLAVLLVHPAGIDVPADLEEEATVAKAL
jgi:nucleotide-binding universal stress UspA family protein